jgi:hypothetical protein
MTIETGIDLNFCVKGQKVKLRDGTIGTYYGLLCGGEIYPHNVQGWSYTSNGKYWKDERVSNFDVIEILSLESDMNIDLSTCVRGQKVKLRDGTIGTYYGVIDENEIYTHAVNGYSYTRRGTFWMENDRTSPKDVVKILPLESPMNIDLTTCVPGQKVKLRNGDIVKYTGSYPEGNADPYAHSVDGYAYMTDGSYWKDGRKTDLDVVEILPIEEEPTKPTPELTHSITDQIDVANPDHVSIIPHSDGVTICIKKGLTTISWRHYSS